MNKQGNSILVTPRSFRKIDGPHWDKLGSSPFKIIKSPHESELMTEDEIIEIVSTHNVGGIIVGLDPLPERVLSQAPSLKIVAKYGTGLDNIDLKAAEKAGIIVTYTPGANTQSVADLACGLMLALARWIPAHDRYLRDKRLKRQRGNELWEKTLGIVGLGQIGTAVARRAKGFNMDVIYNSRSRKNIQESILDVKYRELDKLLKDSDFVSLHCALTDKTRNLIGSEELSRMKDEAFLINTARYGLIDEKPLLAALKNGTIAGAAVDTFDSEESLDTKLLGLDNFIGSPHTGASTVESVLRMADMATEEVLRVLNGEKPVYPVE